jgi:hypothetical protein
MEESTFVKMHKLSENTRWLPTGKYDLPLSSKPRTFPVVKLKKCVGNRRPGWRVAFSAATHALFGFGNRFEQPLRFLGRGRTGCSLNNLPQRVDSDWTQAGFGEKPRVVQLSVQI